MNVGAVIFDWGGTLTPWHEIDFREEWMSYARTWGGADYAALAERIIAEGEAAWARARVEHTSTHVEDILRAAGVDPDDERHPAAYAAYAQYWQQHTHTNPQVRPLWERLHRNGIRVGVLSNTIWSGAEHRAIFARDNVLDLIDADIYSSEIPWTKPHPEAFEAAADAVGVSVHECVYVGDRLFEDVHGPQQAGMRAIWIPHSNIPSTQYVETDATPDAVAAELMDVATIVETWSAA